MRNVASSGSDVTRERGAKATRERRWGGGSPETERADRGRVETEQVSRWERRVGGVRGRVYAGGGRTCGMTRVLRRLAGAVGVAAVAVGVWDAWARFGGSEVETVPYTVVERDGAFEVREYPDVVVARTVAGSQREAFRRLFAYIDGANEGGRDVAMTAPVATTTGVDVAMTAPVATEPVEAGVEMSFFLPSTYTLDGAPVPTDDRVELDVVEHRRVAAYRFSWFATEASVDRGRRRLGHALADRGLSTAGDHELHRYDDPRTPPWQRRNELVVELA